MKPGLKQEFAQRWSKYFPGAELPIAFYYTDNGDQAPVHRITEGQHCFVDDLAAIRQGRALSFDTKSIACFGGKRYLGFSQEPDAGLRVLPLLRHPRKARGGEI